MDTQTMITRNQDGSLPLVRLSPETSGDCPCGCGDAAFAFGMDGFDGYVDAAPACAQDAGEEALLSSVEFP